MAAGLWLCLWALPGSAGPVGAASIVHAPSTLALAATERGEYRARDARSRETLWEHRWHIERATRDARTVVRVFEEGDGRRGSPLPSRWTARMEVEISDAHRRIASRREVQDATGRLLQTEEREFDYLTGVGRVTASDLISGATSTRPVRLSRGTLAIEMLPVELRSLPSRPEHRMGFDLVLDEGRVVPMQAKIVGREAVQVPAGWFWCYRIELVPAGLLGTLADLFVPRSVLWHTVTAPHVWVKHAGAESGPGSREIVRELVWMTPPPP